MNRLFAFLQALGVKNTRRDSLYTKGASLLLRRPQSGVSLKRGLFYSEDGAYPLLGGEAPAEWGLEDGLLSRIPIEYACGWRSKASDADLHVPTCLELPADLFPDGDFTLSFTAALPGMDYLGSGHYIKAYQDESEHWSYLLRTPNFSVYTKHKKKTDSLGDGEPVPVTAFYHFYNESGEWRNPPLETRLPVEGQPFFARLTSPCTYEYTVKESGYGTVFLHIRILDPAGAVLYNAKKEIPKPDGRGSVFRFALDVPVRFYALTLYPRVLEEQEKAANRFATLCEFFDIDTVECNEMSDTQRQVAISALLQTLSFEDGGRAAQEKYDAAVAAAKESI